MRVSSVVVVGAAISGMKVYVLERVSKVLGVNRFMIARMASSGRMTEEQWERMNRRNPQLGWHDVDWLVRQCTSCDEVGAQTQRRIDLKREGQEMIGVPLAGVTANMGKIEDKTMEEGRFLLPHEVAHPMLVCVIGMDIRQKFFPLSEPLGKTLKVRGVDLRIVGVEARRGSMLGQSLDNQMYIPVTTFERLFGRAQSLQISEHGLIEWEDDERGRDPVGPSEPFRGHSEQLRPMLREVRPARQGIHERGRLHFRRDLHEHVSKKGLDEGEVAPGEECRVPLDVPLRLVRLKRHLAVRVVVKRSDSAEKERGLRLGPPRRSSARRSPFPIRRGPFFITPQCPPNAREISCEALSLAPVSSALIVGRPQRSSPDLGCVATARRAVSIRC
jgi:hypothetical protein